MVNGSEYEEYKKFNVHEMYRSGIEVSSSKADKSNAEAPVEKEAS